MDESQVLEQERVRVLTTAFGLAHSERKSRIGKRLNYWYIALAGWVAAAALLYYAQGYFFIIYRNS